MKKKKEEVLYNYIIEKQKGIIPCLGDGRHYIKGNRKTGVCFRCLMALSYMKK